MNTMNTWLLTFSLLISTTATTFAMHNNKAPTSLSPSRNKSGYFQSRQAIEAYITALALFYKTEVDAQYEPKPSSGDDSVVIRYRKNLKSN